MANPYEFQGYTALLKSIGGFKPDEIIHMDAVTFRDPPCIEQLPRTRQYRVRKGVPIEVARAALRLMLGA